MCIRDSRIAAVAGEYRLVVDGFRVCVAAAEVPGRGGGLHRGSCPPGGVPGVLPVEGDGLAPYAGVGAVVEVAGDGVGHTGAGVGVRGGEGEGGRLWPASITSERLYADIDVGAVRSHIRPRATRWQAAVVCVVVAFAGVRSCLAAIPTYWSFHRHRIYVSCCELHD